MSGQLTCRPRVFPAMFPQAPLWDPVSHAVVHARAFGLAVTRKTVSSILDDTHHSWVEVASLAPVIARLIHAFLVVPNLLVTHFQPTVLRTHWQTNGQIRTSSQDRNGDGETRKGKILWEYVTVDLKQQAHYRSHETSSYPHRTSPTYPNNEFSSAN